MLPCRPIATLLLVTLAVVGPTACGKNDADKNAPTAGPSEAERLSAQAGVDSVQDASDAGQVPAEEGGQRAGGSGRSQAARADLGVDLGASVDVGNAISATVSGQSNARAEAVSAAAAALQGAASLGTKLPMARHKCRVAAVEQGRTADANAFAGLALGLQGASLSGQAAAGTGARAGAGDAAASTLLHLDFSVPACRMGRVALLGQQLIEVSGTTAQRQVAVASDVVALVGQAEVSITSLDTQKPTYVVVTSEVGDRERQVSVSTNEHRVRKVLGKAVLDQTVVAQGDDAVVVAEAFADADADATGEVLAGRTVVRGKQQVEHRLAGFTSTHAFNQLKVPLAEGCRCPASGTLSQEVVYADKRTVSHTYAFTACGQAKVTTRAVAEGVTSESTAEVTWDNCQP